MVRFWVVIAASRKLPSVRCLLRVQFRCVPSFHIIDLDLTNFLLVNALRPFILALISRASTCSFLEWTTRDQACNSWTPKLHEPRSIQERTWHLVHVPSHMQWSCQARVHGQGHNSCFNVLAMAKLLNLAGTHAPRRRLIVTVAASLWSISF